MVHYQAYITEKDTARIAYIDDYHNIGWAASQLVEDAHVREGAEVLIATMSFDYPSQRFKAVEYRFTVEDGKVKDLAMVKDSAKA